MSKNQIDNVLVNQEFFDSINDCKASKLGVVSDYAGLMVRLSLKLTRKMHKLHEKQLNGRI